MTKNTLKHIRADQVRVISNQTGKFNINEHVFYLKIRRSERTNIAKIQNDDCFFFFFFFFFFFWRLSKRMVGILWHF